VIVQLLSDLHFEFHADAGRSFVASLDPAGVDVLVLAGDIAVGPGIVDALSAFAARYAASTVLYVHGNHEYYGSTREDVTRITRRAVRENRNVEWLDGDVVVVEGVRFVGTTLWFPKPALVERLKGAMADFSEIRDFETWVYQENTRARRFLAAEVRHGDVVVTHHLPSWRSVSPRYTSHPLNPFFLCDMEDEILERRPALWLHGHTHDSVDATLGSTRILCNPFGYAGFETNPDFKDRLVVEI
jgi:predicted phosphodiesterase